MSVVDVSRNGDRGELTARGRMIILVCAFLGWLCAGFHMAITSIAMQPAAVNLLAHSGQLDVARWKDLSRQSAAIKSSRSGATLSDADRNQLIVWDELVAQWFAWNQCAFLFGAASGGLFFGRLGDRLGRSRAMSLSILTYSLMSAAAATAQQPWQLFLMWYLAATGVGGMWPNGVALVAEAWSSLSRPVTAGIIGTSANIGIFMLSTLTASIPVIDASWRWIFLVGASPLLLGVISLCIVPESPHWLAARRQLSDATGKQDSMREIFSHPWLGVTLVGILLATIPMIGAWGSANWMVPWAGQAGNAATPPNPFLKANVQQYRSITGIIGSLLGGWIGNSLGRRRTYFLTSLAALLISQYTFWYIVPTDASFLYWVAALGFFSGIYFGWMPLFLPELFPTRIRSTGAGVSFNFGRILTTVTIFLTGILSSVFKGDYAGIGRTTSLVFILGMIAIWLVPPAAQSTDSGEAKS